MSYKSLFLSGCALVLAGCCGWFGSGEVKLAEDGRALADIVIAEKASVAAQFGARDLQWHLKKMTGADFRIIRDTEPQTRYEIRVGESSRTKHRADEFKKQKYLVDVGEKATELIGWDGVQKGYKEVTLEFPENAAPKGKNWPTVYTRQGSMYAVYEFLERWCGVRWANFTRYGTLLPQRPALTVAHGSYAGEPFMYYRGGTMDTVWGGDTSPMWFYTPQCSNYVNWCAAAFPGGVKDADTYDRLWLLRNRAGGELQPACHSFGWLYEKYWDEGSRAFVEKRPQYFAKGYPNRPPQPCFSNPELIKAVVADARAYFDRGGGRWGENAYCLEPEDGSSFCQCPDCTRQFEPARSKDSSQHSSYWFRFVNAVAREVKKTHPDKLVTTLAYATHQGVPTGFDVEDNVCIYSCLYHNRERPGNPLYRGEIARMREWHDRQPQVKLAVWLYNCFPLLSGSWGKYNTFPGFFAHEAVRQYRELHELGARGGVFHCGFNGEVANYMQLKLMIDPLRDVEDLLKEHFSIYGKAAPAMREFYDLVEERYADESYYPKKGGGGQFLSWGCLGTKDLMDRLADCMKRAEAAAETESEKALVRLFKLDVWDYMCAGYATYQSRASTPLPSWTAKRVAAGAEGDPDKVDWTKASSVTTQFYKSGCAEKVPSEVTVRLAHDGKWLYLELGEKTDVKKLVVAAAVCPCDTWEVLLARQCGVPYRYYIAGPDARGLAYCHGEEGVRNGAAAEEVGAKFFGAKCRTDRTQKDRWTTRFAFPLDGMTEKPVKPGETVYMNAVRVMNSALSPSGGMAVYSLVSHSYVHVPDRLGEIALEK